MQVKWISIVGNLTRGPFKFINSNMYFGFPEGKLCHYGQWDFRKADRSETDYRIGMKSILCEVRKLKYDNLKTAI